MKKQDYCKNIKIKRINSHIRILSKFFLKRQGKKDGKRGIPSITTDNQIMSPNIKKEHDRVYSYMAYIIRIISSYNAHYYHELQALIAKLDAKIKECIIIKQITKDKPSEISLYIPTISSNPEFENFLNSKHTLEQSLDSIAIRKRRFEEYQSKLSKYRIKEEALSVEINEIYENIMVCLDIIKRTLELSEPIFWESCSVIDIRLSWYWQGVLLKHAQAEKLPPIVSKPNCSQYDNYIKSKIDEIEQLTQVVQDKYQNFKKM